MSFVAVLRKRGCGGVLSPGGQRRVCANDLHGIQHGDFYRSTSVLTRVHAHMLARANQNIAHTQVSACDSTHTQMEALS